MSRGNGTAVAHARPNNKRPNQENGGAPRSGAPETRLKHYLALARAAETSGDAVESQSYYQHAEYYFRQMNSPSE
jgi:hypothetical protein